MANNKPRKLTYKIDGNGCHVVTSHKPNKDGYIRLPIRPNVTELLHRTVYRHFHNIDRIPDGMEIDHICRVRNCCNPAHLQLLTRDEHLAKTHNDRYSDIREAAYIYHVATLSNVSDVADRFNITYKTATRYIDYIKNSVSSLNITEKKRLVLNHVSNFPDTTCDDLSKMFGLSRSCCSTLKREVVPVFNIKDIEDEACCFWKEHKCTGADLGRVFGISKSTACRLIKSWKEVENV